MRRRTMWAGIEIAEKADAEVGHDIAFPGAEEYLIPAGQHCFYLLPSYGDSAGYPSHALGERFHGGSLVGRDHTLRVQRARLPALFW